MPLLWIQTARKLSLPDIPILRPRILRKELVNQVGAISVLKDAKNADNAKKFMDWILTADAQNLYADVPSYAAPTNPKATVGADVPREDIVKKVAWDTRKAADGREAFIAAFESDVASADSAQ